MKIGKTALLVIDVQKGMFADPADPVFNGNELLETIQKTILKTRTAGIPIIFIQHNEGPGYLLDPQTEGFEVHPKLNPMEGDLRVTKTHADSFWDTDLKKKLDDLGISELIITGMQTEFCVDTTCRAAASLGYNSYLIKDGHGTFNSPVLDAPAIIRHHNYVLDGSFVKLIGEKDIIFD